MTQLFANNAYGSLGATLASGATSLTLATGQGARFPSPTGGDFFLLTLVGLDSNGNENAWEIVKVTGRSTDALTIVRAQEGTTAATWIAGTRAELRATAGTFDSLTDATEAAAAAPVQSVAGRTGAVTLTKSDVGLANVENKSSATIRGELTSGNVTTALGFTPENAANRNAANGYAGLDASGLVPSSLLPSFVDDVLEYANYAALPAIGESGKIYVLLTPYTSGGITSSQFRWSGSAYTAIVASPGTTDAVTEGSLNLYFTNARAQAALAGMYLPSGGGTLTGDLVFASGTKITGDFSSATRTVVQTSTTNGSTNLSLIPNGTAVNSQINVWGNSNTTNAPLGTFVVNSTSVRLTSGAAGTGTVLPLSFWIGSNEAARFDPTTRNFLLGNTVDDGANKLQVTGNGTITGNFGVGTNAPTSFGGGFRTFEVAGSTAADGGVLRSRTSDSSIVADFFTSSTFGGAVLRTTTNHPLLLRPNDVPALRLNPVSSAVNYLAVDGAATGNSPVLSAVGSDANINITLTAKGTGKVISSGDMTVNGLTVGRGGASVSTNTVVGAGALASNTAAAGRNTVFGYSAGGTNATGQYNAFFGYMAGRIETSSGNTHIGDTAGYNTQSTSGFNTFIGQGAGSSVTSGSKNTILGAYNGNQGGLDIRTASNVIVLSDGDGNPGIVIRRNSGGSYFFSGPTTSDPSGASYYSTISSNGSDVQVILQRTGTGTGWGGIGASAGYALNVYSENFAGTPMRVSTDGVVVLKGGTGSPNGTGIAFPATQNASSDANTLDDYEEGTFTPFIYGSTTSGTGTYQAQNGRYVKVGRSITFTIELQWNAHSGTGYMYVGGLPFTATDNSAISCRSDAVTLNANSYMFNNVMGGTSNILLAQSAVGSTNGQNINIDSAGFLLLAGTYIATA